MVAHYETLLLLLLLLLVCFSMNYIKTLICITMMVETVHCGKSNTEFFSRPYSPVLSPNTGKYGPEKLLFT